MIIEQVNDEKEVENNKIQVNLKTDYIINMNLVLALVQATSCIYEMR